MKIFKYYLKRTDCVLIGYLTGIGLNSSHGARHEYWLMFFWLLLYTCIYWAAKETDSMSNIMEFLHGKE